MGSTLGGHDKDVADDDSITLDALKLNGAIERIVAGILDNEVSRTHLSRLSEILKVNIENLDDSTVKERIVGALLNYFNKTAKYLPSPPSEHSISNEETVDDSTLNERNNGRNLELCSSLQIETNSSNNVETDADSTLDGKVTNRILYLNSNQELFTRHRSDLADFAKALGINIEKLEDSGLTETVLNRLLELKNERTNSRPVPFPSTVAKPSRHSDNEWWENSKYFDRLDSESDLSATKPEEPLKCGDCYIFNYQKFEKGLEARPGSENDVARLRHDFNALDFNVYGDFLDLTKELTLDTLKQAAKNDHTKNKCFVCCFLTHGEDGSLLTSNGYLKVDEILECFSRSACESLAGKPKIFIFEACGENFNGEEGSGSESHTKIPDYQDFLLLYSTYEGKPSSVKEKEDINHGSFFINELCRTLEQFSTNTNLLQILTILNFRVTRFRLNHTDEEEIDNTKHLPGFTSRLTTELKFSKKIKAYVSEDTKYFDTRRRNFFRFGKQSTRRPFEDKKFYTIGDPKRIKFLLMLNTKNHTDFYDSPSSLLPTVIKRGYRSAMLSKWSVEELRNFCKEVPARGLSNTDCLVCFIVCLAKGQYLYDIEGERFLKKDLVELFTGKECSDLREKPKIFIFLTSSMAKETWTSCFFADIVDNDEDNTIPVHSDLLDVTIAIESPKQLKDVVGKFSDIFGKECSEDFLSQLTKINKEFPKDSVLVPVKKKSLPLEPAAEKPSPVISKLPSTLQSRPQKTKNPFTRVVKFLSSSNTSQTPSQIPPQNSVSSQNFVKEESKDLPISRAAFCFNSTLTATLILNKITVPELTEN